MALNIKGGQNNSMNKKQYIVLGVFIVVLVGGAYVMGRRAASPPPIAEQAPAQNQTSTTEQPVPSAVSATQSITAKPTANSVAPSTKPTGTTSPTAPKTGIRILSPSEGDTWAQGPLKRIEWTSPLNALASAYLSDAITGKTVGWIIAAIEPWQTGFSWDGRFAYVSKTGGNTIPVNPGQYKIHVVPSDGRAEMVSATFNIAPEKSNERLSVVIRISEQKPNPAIVETTAGSLVYIVNNDKTSIKLLSSLFETAEVTLSAGQALQIVTTPSQAGKYYSIFSPVLPYQDFISIRLK